MDRIRRHYADSVTYALLFVLVGGVIVLVGVASLAVYATTLGCTLAWRAVFDGLDHARLPRLRSVPPIHAAAALAVLVALGVDAWLVYRTVGGS